MSSDKVSVELLNLQVFARAKRALLAEPISMRCDPGSLNVLTGPNGAGKTSVLDVIAMRTEPRDYATVRRAGHARPTDIAYLPQHLWDVFDIRVGDLVALAAGWFGSLPACAPDLLAAVLATPRNELGMLSGGQRQLLIFWLVSVQPRRIFVYDEPFCHLDSRASEYVVKTIKSQVAGGMLVVLSEHSPDPRWAASCNRVTLKTRST